MATKQSLTGILSPRKGPADTFSALSEAWAAARAGRARARGGARRRGEAGGACAARWRARARACAWGAAAEDDSNLALSKRIARWRQTRPIALRPMRGARARARARNGGCRIARGGVGGGSLALLPPLALTHPFPYFAPFAQQAAGARSPGARACVSAVHSRVSVSASAFARAHAGGWRAAGGLARELARRKQ